MAKPNDAETFLDLFRKAGEQLHLPKLDIEAILDHHRKNFEALQKSAATTAEGVTSVMAKQRDAMQDMVREIGEMAESYKSLGNPRDALTRQVEFARRSFEAAVQNVTEVAQTMQKTGSASTEILKERIREAMEEIRGGQDRRG